MNYIRSLSITGKWLGKYYLHESKSWPELYSEYIIHKIELKHTLSQAYTYIHAHT